MKARDIYQKFGIPENLQKHMLRVTRVGILITEGWKGEINKDLIIKAGLVHDLANMVKFKLDTVSELIEKQKEVITKYGSDDHTATEKMLREIGVSEEIIEVVQNKSFGNAIKVVSGDNWPLKILFYSDMRVIPTGVVDLETRLNDVVTRLEKYKNNPDKDKLIESAREIEKQIQEKTITELNEISDEEVGKGMESLLDYELFAIMNYDK